MANNDSTKEILNVANQHDLVEVGGSHGQKGVDFQRYWALMRIFELEESGKEDFLFLFEAVQDVAEFDSSSFPTAVRVYQVKKKDRGEWSWTWLTKLPKPTGKKPVEASKLPEIKESPIGKLYASVRGCKKVCVNGHPAGHCHLITRNHNDRRQEAITARPHRWIARQLQEARRPDWRRWVIKAVDQGARRARPAGRDGRAPGPRQA